MVNHQEKKERLGWRGLGATWDRGSVPAHSRGVGLDGLQGPFSPKPFQEWMRTVRKVLCIIFMLVKMQLSAVLMFHGQCPSNVEKIKTSSAVTTGKGKYKNEGFFLN